MNKGFTLIELLVVVLIIGILVAIAVPKCERAIWTTRARLLQATVKSVADAQQRYILANGGCAQSFEELDISLDSLPNTTVGLSTVFFMIYPINPLSNDAVRGNDYIEVALAGFATSANRTVCWTLGRFKKGPWQGGNLSNPEGFGFPHYDYRLGNTSLKHMYCIEGTGENRFCQHLLHENIDHAKTFQNARLYKL